MRKKLWLVVRFSGNQHNHEGGIQIKEDDTIRVGRITFKVRELVQAPEIIDDPESTVRNMNDTHRMIEKTQM
jgi:hypothetical protein